MICTLAGENKDLKQMLANPHLRSMMIDLLHSKQVAFSLKSALKEPIFQEMAVKCVTTLNTQ